MADNRLRLKKLWDQKIDSLDSLVLLFQQQYEMLLKSEDIEEVQEKIIQVQQDVDSVDHQLTQQSTSFSDEEIEGMLSNYVDEVRSRLTKLDDINRQTQQWILDKVKQVGNDLQGIHHIRKMNQGYMNTGSSPISPRFMDEKG
jgi:homoaconitase/3-isopropylmalate dehydratase large subunit